MYRKKVLLEKSFKFRLCAVVFKGIFFFFTSSDHLFKA